MHREAVEKVEVIYSGKLAEMETDMITRAAMKGVLEPVLMEHVNYVNALIAADHRGIAITESKENGDQDLLTVKVITKKGEFVASGRVVGRGQVRIAEIDGYQFDVEPTPYMLVANNEDKPGMIGQIGTLLGASKVNIATMQVSRNQKNGIAMMFLTVDSDVPADVLKLLKNVGGITKVNMVKI